MKIDGIDTHADRQRLTAKVSVNPADLALTETPFGLLPRLKGAVLSGEPGAPALPVLVTRVALPPGASLAEVSARAVTSVAVSGPGRVLAPLQLAQPGASEPITHCTLPAKPARPYEDDQPGTQEGGDDAFGPRRAAPPFQRPNADLYQRAYDKPRALATGRLATAAVGMNPIALIEISPLRPRADGTLELATEIELEVRWTRQGESAAGPVDGGGKPVNRISSRLQAERQSALAKSLVLNPDGVIDLWPWFDVLGEVDYLIVTDNRRWDADTSTPGDSLNGDMVAAFQRLAAWKATRGLRTRVVTVSDIVSGRFGDHRVVRGVVARDLQEVLRNFLKWALDVWGVSFVLLGGDIDVIPVRSVVGFGDGGVSTTATDPPEAFCAHWSGSFLKLNYAGAAANRPLLSAASGQHIPYDAAGTSGPTQRGWYFTTDDTYATRTTMATAFLRVNGPAAEINGALQWVFYENTIPTDLYYASLRGPRYGLPGTHDWDLVGTGFYGQHNDSDDLDGVAWHTDVSVGRAPTSAAAEATAFVDKVIAYESFRRPDGTALDASWPRRAVFGAANWGGRIGLWSTASSPPGDNQYHHAPGAPHTLIKVATTFSQLEWRLLAQVSAGDVRVLGYNRSASATSPGWYFAQGATNLAPSELVIPLPFGPFRFPIPTPFVAVFGAAAVLTPEWFILDWIGADGSMADQEQLREQVRAELPAVNAVSRLYEDEVDLTAAQLAAGPVEHLTEAGMMARINQGPHFVSLSGHGWWGGCCGYGISTAENSTNGFHSYIAYADSCLTNEFNLEAVSERSLLNPRGGAVAYLGNSRYSWIGVGDNFQRAFFHQLPSARHLGHAFDARCALLDEGTGFYRRYNKWSIFALNLMGDPEMPVWTGPPRTLIVRHALQLDKRLPFVISVSQRLAFGLEFPASDAVVTVTQNGFRSQQRTDGAGRVSIDLSTAQLGDLEVTVTKLGFRPFFDQAAIVGPAWIVGKVQAIAHQERREDATEIYLVEGEGTTARKRHRFTASRTRNDYGIILDAATDAYVTGEAIQLFVASIKGGGLVEKFRFGSLLDLSEVFDATTTPLVTAVGEPAVPRPAPASIAVVSAGPITVGSAGDLVTAQPGNRGADPQGNGAGNGLATSETERPAPHA